MRAHTSSTRRAALARALAASARTLVACALALSFVARAAAQQQPPTPARESRGKGTITVRVVGDDNQPIANAVVTALQLGSTGRYTNDNSGATTGRYVLSNLDPGVYRVTANAPGYVQESDPFADASTQNLYRPGDAVSFRLIKGGVITGRVTDAAGEPVVGASVAVQRVRDSAGRVAFGTGFEAFYSRWRTDDRGVYRVFGLHAGSYLVRAGGRSNQNFSSRFFPHDADAPTYYPSTTRDGAVEVQVQTGQEVADVDIRYRGERGRAISGTVAGALATNEFGSSGAAITLRHAATGAAEGSAYVSGSTEPRAFVFEGIADGEYELTASSAATDKDTGTASAPARVTVRGADVTGLRLALAPLASVAGRVTFEPLTQADAARPECKDARAPVPQELIVSAVSDAPGDATPSVLLAARERAPDERGEFTIRNLPAGRYRLALRLVDENLYARSFTQSAAPPAAGQGTTARAAVSDLARNGLSVGAGERVAGVAVTVSAGAASLRGRITDGDGGAPPAGNWRVHLVPAEAERAEDVPRYSETLAQPDGSFAFRNLAPGRYHLLARPVAEAELRGPARQRRAAWDATARAELRREAEAAKTPVALTPCQRAEDFTLRLTRPASN